MATEPLLFRTARLACRRWVPEDVDQVHAVYSDEKGARFVDDGQPITRADSEGWMAVTAANYAQRGYGMFAVVDGSTGEVVGFCGLVHPGGQEDVEIKYAFHRRHWGKGYASEVVPAMLAWARDALGITRVIATVAEAHGASRRVLEKAGMRLVGSDEPGSMLYEWVVPD